MGEVQELTSFNLQLLNLGPTPPHILLVLLLFVPSLGLRENNRRYGPMGDVCKGPRYWHLAISAEVTL